MVTITLILIGVFFLGFGALLATRRRFGWAGVSIAAAILCGVLLFWSNTEILEDDSGVTPVPAIPASPVAVQRDTSPVQWRSG